MITILEKYIVRGSFEFRLNDKLGEVCKAPKKYGGVYLLYDITKTENLIYIGSSGCVKQDGTFGLRKGGMYDRIVNGKQTFSINGETKKEKRKIIWPIKMKEDKIKNIRIDWFVTFINEIIDIPAFVEGELIQKFYEGHRKLPLWNKEY